MAYRNEEGRYVLDPDECIVAEIHENLMYDKGWSTIKAYEHLRCLSTPVALRPSTPWLDEIFEDEVFRDYLMHRTQ